MVWDDSNPAAILLVTLGSKTQEVNKGVGVARRKIRWNPEDTEGHRDLCGVASRRELGVCT